MKTTSDNEQARVSLKAAVLTISDRHSAETDKAGDYLIERLTAHGHQCVTRLIVADDVWLIRRAVCDWVAQGPVQVVITNGGTGHAAGKSTIAAIKPMMDHVITGFGELFRQLSYQDVGSSALQSEAFGGLANGRLLFCLPGSPAACQLAWERIIQEQLDSTHRPCNFASEFR